MEQSIVPLIPVDLDKRRHLLFRKRDVRYAEVVFEQELGKPRTFFTALLQLMDVIQAGEVGALSTNNLCILYWLGLRHEDPGLTLDDVETLLPLMAPGELIGLVVKLFEAWQAQTPPADGRDHGGIGRDQPFGLIDWAGNWAFARISLGLSDQAFWDLTFLEFHWLKEAYFRQVEQTQRPQALLVWRVFNYLRGEHDQPTSYEEMRRLLGYLPAPEPPAPPRPSVEELQRRLEVIHTLHKLTSTNGQSEEGA